MNAQKRNGQFRTGSSTDLDGTHSFLNRLSKCGNTVGPKGFIEEQTGDASTVPSIWSGFPKYILFLAGAQTPDDISERSHCGARVQSEGGIVSCMFEPSRCDTGLQSAGGIVHSTDLRSHVSEWSHCVVGAQDSVDTSAVAECLPDAIGKVVHVVNVAETCREIYRCYEDESSESVPDGPFREPCTAVNKYSTILAYALMAFLNPGILAVTSAAVNLYLFLSNKSTSTSRNNYLVRVRDVRDNNRKSNSKIENAVAEVKPSEARRENSFMSNSAQPVFDPGQISTTLRLDITNPVSDLLGRGTQELSISAERAANLGDVLLPAERAANSGGVFPFPEILSERRTDFQEGRREVRMSCDKVQLMRSM